MCCARIYQFHPAKIPVVNYQGLMEVHTRWTQTVGHGPTYGECVRTAWLESKSLGGIVCLEHDIAVSREGWMELGQMATLHPQDVAVIPYYLYPRSTGRKAAVWAHRVDGPDGAWTFVPGSAAPPLYPTAFSLGCAYLPGRLLDAMPDDLTQWDYPALDTRLSYLARDQGLACRSTLAPAIHLHY